MKQQKKYMMSQKQFSALNNQYRMESQVSQIFKAESNDKFPRKKNGKVDSFVIMAQLRHLQNMASLNNAQHQKYERQRNQKHISKNSIRKAKKWMKIQGSLNQPYLKIYQQFQKQKQSIQKDQNLEAETQSQYSINESAGLTSINYSKQLRPYKKIIQYTQQKIRIKNQLINQSPISQKKLRNLEQLRSAQKNKSFYKDYTQISNKLIRKKEQEKKKKQGGISTQQIVSKKINRIFKKTHENHKFQEIKDEERFQKLIKKQKQLLQQNLKEKDQFEISNKNFMHVRRRLESIVVEISKSGSKINQYKRKISQSLDLSKRQASSQF